MARLASRSSLLYFLYFIYVLLFHTLAHSFAVFCTPRKLNSFLFNRFRTLCQNTRGGGTSCPSTRIKMKPQTANPVVQSARCSHRDPKGRQCRALALDRRSGLCPRHLAEQQQELAADHFRHLTTRCQFFQTAQGINYSLMNLYQLLAQNRISPRQSRAPKPSLPGTKTPTSTMGRRRTLPIPTPPMMQTQTRRQRLKRKQRQKRRRTHTSTPPILGTPPSLSPTRRRNHHECWPVRNCCNRMRLWGKLCGSRGVMDGDDEANSVRGCNAGDSRECLARSERRTNRRTERRARRGSVDGYSGGNVDRWRGRRATQEPTYFCARGAH